MSNCKLIDRFGNWELYSDGSLCHDGYYWITADRLKEPLWIRHLSEKRWINWNTFIPAYMKALAIIDCKKLEIIVQYEADTFYN